MHGIAESASLCFFRFTDSPTPQAAMGRDGKRRQEGGGGGKPNKRRFLNKPPPSSSRPGIPLQTRGILISCVTGREQQAGREAVALLSECYERLGGTWKQGGAAEAAPDSVADGGGDAPPTDFAAALAAEVSELKDGSRQPFYYHLTGIHSVIYVECKDAEGPSPSALALAACQEAADSQVCRTRFCSRLYPIEHTCYASLDKIEELAGAVVAQHFPEGAEQPIQFAVQYDARAASQLNRMDVINAFATKVPAPHKVSLDHPQKTILVSILKTTCGVAVVHRFKELCRYNMQTLALSEEEREAQKEAQREQQRAQQPAGERKQQDGKEEQQQEKGEEQGGGEAQGEQKEPAAAAAEEQQDGKEEQAPEAAT